MPTPLMHCPTCGQPVNTMDSEVLDNFMAFAEPEKPIANNGYREHPAERIVSRPFRRGRIDAPQNH